MAIAVFVTLLTEDVIRTGIVIVADPPLAIEPKLTVIWFPETDTVPWLTATLEANASPVGNVSETVTPVSVAWVTSPKSLYVAVRV